MLAKSLALKGRSSGVEKLCRLRDEWQCPPTPCRARAEACGAREALCGMEFQSSFHSLPHTHADTLFTVPHTDSK